MPPAADRGPGDPDHLAHLLLARLRADSEIPPFELLPSPRPSVRFPAVSDLVGDAILILDSDEVTLRLDKHTHCHFPTYMHDDLPVENQVAATVEDALDFLRRLFSDQIVIWSRVQEGRVGAGGMHDIGVVEPALRQPGARAFLWSGKPVTPAASGGT